MGVWNYGKRKGCHLSPGHQQERSRFSKLKKRLAESSFYGSSFVSECHRIANESAAAEKQTEQIAVPAEEVFLNASKAHQSDFNVSFEMSSGIIFNENILELHEDTKGTTPGHVNFIQNVCVHTAISDTKVEQPTLFPVATACQTDHFKTRIGVIKRIRDESLRHLESWFNEEKERIIKFYKTEEARIEQEHRQVPARSCLRSFPAHTPQLFSSTELRDALGLRQVPFSEMPSNPVKLAEASFSEVFKVGNLVYKIIPFNEHYGDEQFAKEAAVLVALRNQPGVAPLVDLFTVRGAYSSPFINAWRDFKNTENQDPAIYTDSQVYGCIVMEDCGKDLESVVFKDSKQIALFAVSLIQHLLNLQSRFAFEHRDLHWGNILVKNDKIYIIDFSFSRLEFSLDRLTNESRGTAPKLVYTDLEKEEWLFDGNETVDEQFAIYREMRLGSKRRWAEFTPSSNGLWVRYVLGKLMLKAKALSSQEERRKAREILSKMKNGLLEYSWGAEFGNWCVLERFDE